MQYLFLLLFFKLLVNGKTTNISFVDNEILNDERLLKISDYLKEYYYISGKIDKIEFIIDDMKNMTCLTMRTNDLKDNILHKRYYEYSDILNDVIVIKTVNELMLYFKTEKFVLFSIDKHVNNSNTKICAVLY